LTSDGPANAALVSLPVLCWRPWPHCTGVITNIALLLLPALRRHHCPRCVGAFVLVALAWLPLLPLRCRQHHELASTQSQSSRNTRWHRCQHCAIVVANVAPALLPLLRGHLCPCRAGAAALGTPALPPASQTGICPVMTQLRHVLGEASLWCSTLLLMALLLYTASAYSNLAFNGLVKAAMAFFLHCAGVLAHIALASLPASSCPCCRCCASVVAELAFKGPAGAALAFAGVALTFLPHHAGVIASIVLLSLSPALRRHHCPCHMGAFALVVLASMPLSPLGCRQHRELASAQSQSSCDTCWRHCQHCAIVVVGVAPALLPLSHGRLCPRPAGVAALGIPELPPASQTCLRPVMMQSQHVAGEALLPCSLLLPVASLLYPASAHSNLAFVSLAKAEMAFFSFSLSLFLALRWCSRSHCTGVIASVKLSSLPALRRRCRQVGPQRSGRYSAGICQRCTGVFPSLRWRHCQHCAAVVVAGVVPALLPSARGCLCPHRAPLMVAFTLPLSLPYMVSLLYPVSSTPVLRFLSPDALAAMHMPFSTTSSSERLTAAAAVVVMTILEATAGCAIWSSSSCHTSVTASITNWRLPIRAGPYHGGCRQGLGRLFAGQRLPWASNQLARGHCCLGGLARTPGHILRPRDVAIGRLLDGRRLPWAHDMLAGGRCCLGGPDRTLGYHPRPLDGRAAMAIARLLWLWCRNQHHVIDANAAVVVCLVCQS
jgi:hypothetical protein